MWHTELTFTEPIVLNAFHYVKGSAQATINFPQIYVPLTKGWTRSVIGSKQDYKKEYQRIIYCLDRLYLFVVHSTTLF
jgi:hypothetical protein